MRTHSTPTAPFLPIQLLSFSSQSSVAKQDKIPLLLLEGQHYTHGDFLKGWEAVAFITRSGCGQEVTLPTDIANHAKKIGVDVVCSASQIRLLLFHECLLFLLSIRGIFLKVTANLIPTLCVPPIALLPRIIHRFSLLFLSCWSHLNSWPVGGGGGGRTP